MSYKSEGTAWLLWAGCFCGCCGLHRCYLNRIGTGVVWWVTGGLCGIGQCLDTCAISSMVAQENIKLTPAVIVVRCFFIFFSLFLSIRNKDLLKLLLFLPLPLLLQLLLSLFKPSLGMVPLSLVMPLNQLVILPPTFLRLDTHHPVLLDTLKSTFIQTLCIQLLIHPACL